MGPRSQYVLAAAIVGAAVLTALPQGLRAVPSYARETGMSCDFCHTQFPELTAAGRQFKLRGYTTVGSVTWVQSDDSSGGDATAPSSPTVPISAMIQASYNVMRSQPDVTATDAGAGADNRGSAMLPQQASLFYAGEVAKNLGAFIQMTYDTSFHFDNTDLRYVRTIKWLGRDLSLGVDMNNNPTVQDLWNSTPAWGFPYAAAGLDNVGPPAPQITSLGGGVMGLGAYAYYGNLLYVELSDYRSSTLGAPAGGAATTLEGPAPYWRVALVQEKDALSLMLGAYGMGMDQVLSNAPNLPSDHYDDVAVDTQVQYEGVDHIGTLLGSFTREKGYGPTAAETTLDVLKATASYLYKRTVGASVGLQDTRDDLGRTQALVYEADYLLALNTKLSLQYTQYLQIQGVGQGSAYALDPNGINGRQPEDNNVLMAQAWMAF